MSALGKRKCFLDPCHSKVFNVTNLQISRMKLKMKLELRTLKKITEDVIQEGDNSVIVVPANVYENPLDTIQNQTHEGKIGYYGSATEEQFKAFFGDSLSVTTNPKDHSVCVENKPVTLDALKSPDKSLSINAVPCPTDDIELQNAIWHISSEFDLENRAVPSEQVSFNDYLMEHAGEDHEGVLFDLS